MEGDYLAGLPSQVIAQIEERYWQPIGDASIPERFASDPALLADPSRYPALFSDHGVTHVRDIAANTHSLATLPGGTLVPERPPERAELIRVVAVLLTYLHDIGMVAPTPEGRRVHPQYAAQVALGSEFSGPADELWARDVGGVATRLRALHSAVGFRVDPQRVFREILAMSLCHSKSAVPSPLLDERGLLRERMQHRCFTPLDIQIERLGATADAHVGWEDGLLTDAGAGYYSVTVDSFDWLDHAAPDMVELADDVIDAVRLLRAGDALRQRGTALCTSAGAEICVDPNTGDAVYALHSKDRSQAVILSVDNIISAAESNVAYAELLPDGVLRLAFNRGFADPAVRQRLAEASADLVADIEADAVGSFLFPSRPPIQLVRLREHDHGFVNAVAQACADNHRLLAGRVVVVEADDSRAPSVDVSWTDQARPLEQATTEELLARMTECGLNAASIDVAAAVEPSRIVCVEAGTVLLDAGTSSSLVVVPLSSGLQAHPENGLDVIDLRPWLPVGATGVVRGGRRNARVVAERDLEVVVIPAEVYLEHWFRPYTIEQMVAIVSTW
ncbi:MAG: hypothetical protein AB8G14_06085 [Ilumatobacter sp.]